MSKRKREELLNLVYGIAIDDDLSDEEVRRELENDGIDISASSERTINRLKNTFAAVRRNRLNVSNDKFNDPESNLVDISFLSLDEVKQEIHSISSAVSFRDLEGQSEEDLRSLLQDLRRLSEKREES